jgi:hypothetical protein
MTLVGRAWFRGACQFRYSCNLSLILPTYQFCTTCG